nr:FAD-dependent oxidoreductase [Bradyrhizobium sp. KB893862 SZCCT0404]
MGGGHAGVQLAASLRDEGYEGPISLINGEEVPPYQRPPLSKGYIHGELSPETISLRGQSFFESKRINLVNQTAVSIDRTVSGVCLSSGEVLKYSHLAIATGSRPRRLELPGSNLDGVYELRSLEDASRIRAHLQSCHTVLVVGAGFIGLEFAAAARTKSIEVEIVELANRPMARSLSPEMSDFFRRAHEETGCRFHFGTRIRELTGSGKHVSGAILDDGRKITADLVLLGVGIMAEDRLAQAAGLICDDGVVVDKHLATSDPAVSAIGDCARHPNPFAKTSIRLESVQNAIDQAKCVARRLTGKPGSFRNLPLFWSDQGRLKLQIAGLVQGCDTFVARGDPATQAFSVFGFGGGKLLCVESVNRPGDYMAARRILDANGTISPDEVADPAFDLKQAAKRSAAAA